MSRIGPISNVYGHALRIYSVSLKLDASSLAVLFKDRKPPPAVVFNDSKPPPYILGFHGGIGSPRGISRFCHELVAHMKTPIDSLAPIGGQFSC